MHRSHKQFKILGPVVVLDPVDVMDDFVRMQRPPELPLHDQAVLSVLLAVWSLNEPITPVLPPAAVGGTESRFVSRRPHTFSLLLIVHMAETQLADRPITHRL